MEFLDNFDGIFGSIEPSEIGNVVQEDVNEVDEDENLENDEREMSLNIVRRPYRRFPRIDFIEMWNDDEFFCRFRMSKGTIVYVLSMIEEQLKPKLYSNR